MQEVPINACIFIDFESHTVMYNLQTAFPAEVNMIIVYTI